MRYMDVKEAGKKWGTSERWVRKLCQAGRVPDVVRSGRDWLIPHYTEKPLPKKAASSKERLEFYLNPMDDACHAKKLPADEQLLNQVSELFFQGAFDPGFPEHITMGSVTFRPLVSPAKV